jgi:Ankyrin repeat
MCSDQSCTVFIQHSEELQVPLPARGRCPVTVGGRYPLTVGGRYPLTGGGRYSLTVGGRYPLMDGSRYPLNVGGRYPLTVACMQNGMTALMAACDKGHVDVVRQLLASPGIDISAANKVSSFRSCVLSLSAALGTEVLIQSTAM